MIYLLDDNKRRQFNSGWDNEKLEKFQGFIQPIYRIADMTPELRTKLSEDKSNVILFHESFFENLENRQSKDVNEIRDRLIKYADNSSNKFYVSFSGSNSERKMDSDKNTATMPVGVLYQNLELFIEQSKLDKKYQLKYLLYGKNFELEPRLLEKLNQAKGLFIQENTNNLLRLDNSFFFRSRLDINAPTNNHATIFNNETENGLHSKVIDSLSATKYNEIFIPICFGNSLSDFNGLRLATHIRCTPTKNQLTKIFIYGSVGMECLINHTYFDILKTENIELIKYSKENFREATQNDAPEIMITNLPMEMSKLNISIPKNYDDNHSIANEFGIYQLAYNAGIDIKEVSEFDSEKLESLYFKWLVAKNGLLEELPESQKDENKTYRHKLRGLKVVGTKIDLSKFK
jgi:hypothetical protein